MRLSGVKWVCGCVRLSGVGRKMNEKMRMNGWERKEEVNGWLGVWGCVGVCGGVWGCVGVCGWDEGTEVANDNPSSLQHGNKPECFVSDHVLLLFV